MTDVSLLAMTDTHQIYKAIQDFVGLDLLQMYM